MLVILSAKMCGYSGDREVTYASAVEFMHNATLLHDDVIDGAALRRGFPSANDKWGDHLTVLVGDYLYSVSNVLFAEAGNPKLLKIVAETIKTISDGEIREAVKSGHLDLTEEEYFDIIYRKTASLFSLSCQAGAIVSEQDEVHEQALGLAFQIMDDLLDITGQQGKWGKPIGNDLKEGHLTLPMIHLLSQATSEEEARLKDAMDQWTGDQRQISMIQQLLNKYASDRYTKEVAVKYATKSKELLNIFPDSIYRQALLSLSDYIIQRNV